jgi:putative intracellular protease/amidase
MAKLQDAGIRVEIASIEGGDPPLDGLEDMKDAVIARYWADAEFRHALANTLRIDDADPSRYSAIMFAGGHGTMWDFPDNLAAQRMIREIDAAGGIVSTVCHGPAALVNARRADGSLLVAGKRLAAFTNDEEEEVQSTNIVPFLLASTLEERGAHHQNAANWADNVVVDGRLITGQNPQSASSLGIALVKALLA